MAQIEWHLKAVFGENFNSLSDVKHLIVPSGSLYDPLGMLVAFYRNNELIAYRDFRTMRFEELYSQVEIRLKKIGGLST